MRTDLPQPTLDAARRLLAVGFCAALAVEIFLGALGIVPTVWTLLKRAAVGQSPFLALSIASAFLMHRFITPPEWRNRELVRGLAVEAVFTGGRAALGMPLLPGLGVGLGTYAVAARLIRWVRARPEGRALQARVFFDIFAFTAFAVLSQAFLGLTALLRPTVFDPFVYAAEGGLGFQPSAAVKVLFGQVPPLAALAGVVYVALPVGLALAHAFQQERSPGSPPRALCSFFLIAIVGYLLYFVFPVIGPRFLFEAVGGGTTRPNPMPTHAILGPYDVARNCMPSLHTAWALAFFFQTRGLSRWARSVGVLWATMTPLAALGFELHYLIDLVVAVPFAVVIDAFSHRLSSARAEPRKRLVGVGLSLVGLWFVALRYGWRLLESNRILTWGLVLATVAIGVVLRRKFTQLLERDAAAGVMPDAYATRPRLPASVLVVGAAFGLSGVAGMVYEVVFAKSLAVTFGSTSLAQATVLATYMAGMGLGALAGARWVESRGNPLRMYAVCELGIAMSCLLAPAVAGVSREAYVRLATNSDPTGAWVVFLQVLCGASVLLVPTTLMGATTPALAQYLARRGSDLGGAIRLLYAVNTVGAGLGALLAGYGILPTMGVYRTLLLAVVMNSGAAVLALVVYAWARTTSPAGIQRAATALVQDSSPMAPSPHQTRAGIAAIVILAVGGMVSLALEVLYVHLLAVVAGTSVYAFSLMLATFLFGLAGGATFTARLKRDGALLPALRIQAFLALSVLLGTYAWNALPGYFASYAGYDGARTFAARELVRAVVCMLAMFPAAFFVGASYPAAMTEVVLAWPRRAISMFGFASALNTAGNVAGVLIAHFVLLPSLGSLRSLYLLAFVSLSLAVGPMIARAATLRRDILVAATSAIVLLVLGPRSFDLTRLASGANVYFGLQAYGRVIDYSESSDGGLTTVAEAKNGAGRKVLTLLTNGKFQGDDAFDREVPAQYGFALCPLLHTTARGAALVIGYGTGVSARAIHDAGFQRVDIVDLASDIFTLANKHFRSVNAAVTAQPNVRSFVTDGRNLLLLRDARYDMVSIEISSIWFAGAASLYNREFYGMVSRRLNEGGVLQQWMQLHHISPRDIASVLATVRSQFPQVWVYFVGSQGVIVACRHDCPQLPEGAAMLDSVKAFEAPLRSFGGSSAGLKALVLLDPKGTDAFLDHMVRSLEERDTEALVSTDDNLRLEYSTPAGNVEEYEPSLRRNLGLLRKFHAKP
jgi:predicted membrane-bound spermidine synthase